MNAIANANANANVIANAKANANANVVQFLLISERSLLVQSLVSALQVIARRQYLWVQCDVVQFRMRPVHTFDLRCNVVIDSRYRLSSCAYAPSFCT